MTDFISDETIEKIEILSKLEMSETEKIRAKADMTEMLDFVDKLKELDTDGVAANSHIFDMDNVFREDVAVCDKDSRDKMLLNAPMTEDDKIVVPKTIVQ